MHGTLFIVVVASLVAGALCRRHGGDDNFEVCRCSRSPRRPNPCANNQGTNNLCGWGTNYVSCTDTICSNQMCPSGQLWNDTAMACAPCDSGYHIAADLPECVCNLGTTFNSSSQSCVACPTNSEHDADECYCNSTGAYPFFSKSEWACLGCPGQYVTHNFTVFLFDYEEVVEYEVCQCPGANDIFDLRSVSCVTCPSGATAVKARVPYARDFCMCPADGQFYNEKMNTCECWGNMALNGDGSACEYASNSDVTTSDVTSASSA